MLSDIVIAQAAKMLPIAKVAEKLGLTDEDLIPYGRYKAKINHKLIHSDRPDGINPGSRAAFCCGWDGAACAGLLLRSGGYVHG